MANESKTLAWRLIVETQGIEKNTREAANSLAKVNTAGRMVVDAFVALKAASAVRWGLQTADMYRTMENRLRLVTESAEELRAVQLQLIQVSNDTRSSYEDTTELFSRMARATQDFGLSQQQVLDVTKTVNQAIRISGATAKEAQQGVIQFAQGMSSGKLAGDELRAVLEQMPRLGRAVADGMGVSYGKLRELGAKGKLSTEAILNALKKTAPEIQKEFAKLNPTLEDTFTLLTSNFKVLLGEFDRGAGITENMVAALTDLNGGFAGLVESIGMAGITFREFVTVGTVALANMAERAWIWTKKIAFYVAEGASYLTLTATTFHDTYREMQAKFDKELDAANENRLNEYDAIATEFAERRKKLSAKLASLNKPGEVKVKPEIDEKYAKLLKDFQGVLRDLAQDTENLKYEQTALYIEMYKGIDAANDYREQTEALAEANAIEQEWREKGLKIGQEELDQIDELAKAKARAARENREQAEAWGVIKTAIEDTKSPTDKAIEQMREIGKALSKVGEAVTDEQITAAQERMQQIANGVSDVYKLYTDSVRSMVSGFVNFLAEGTFDIKSFVSSTIKEIGKLIIQFLILRALKGTAIGPMLEKGEKGMVLDHSSLVPMAQGGIVTGPTMFPMAGGATGLMGEKGPEAVMPLARMSSGHLGVRTTPAKFELINKTGVNATARISETSDRTSIVLEASELGAKIAEDRITRSMRTGYGPSANALSRTYGLRRRG